MGMPAAGAKPEPIDVESHVREILASPAFRKAPSVSTLLEFLLRHRGTGISEYAVAVEALGKRSDFDPKTDATVRVQVSRLRQKLKEYYEQNGAPVRIAIPLGGHELEIVSEPAAMPSSRSWLPNKLRIAMAAIAVLAAGIAVLAVQNRQLQARLDAVQPQRAMPRFWHSFFGGVKSASIYLPMPVFFEWPGTTLKARDPLVNDFADFGKSETLSELSARWGQPTLLQNYTVTSDTFAAFKLVRFLRGTGIDLGVGSSADLSLEAFNDQNVVLIGIPGTSRHIKQLMEKLDFYSIPGEARAIHVRSPGPGEPERYETVTISNTRRTTFGIVAMLPGRAPGTKILLLSGQDSYALVSFLISPASLDLLDQEWVRRGAPDYFQSVVEAEIDGKTVLRAKPTRLQKYLVSH